MWWKWSIGNKCWLLQHSQRQGDEYRCCYIEYSGGQNCEAVTKVQYDDIDKIIDVYESAGYDDVDIDYGSKYIINSLLAIILILL